MSQFNDQSGGSRKNLIASCKRLPNLGEILSPTVQKTSDLNTGNGSRNGSFYCEKFAGGGSCDVCRHMQRETSQVESLYFNRKFAIHGHLVHLKPSQKPKLRWFVYLLEDRGCKLQYVGSTSDVCSRWANTKSACNGRKSKTTGLTSHFMEGCPSDTGPGKEHIRLTLIDFMDTTVERLQVAGHEPGPQCRCAECMTLKRIEDKWIMRLGTFHGESGLNTRDEIVSAVRGNFKLN